MLKSGGENAVAAEQVEDEVVELADQDQEQTEVVEMEPEAEDEVQEVEQPAQDQVEDLVESIKDENEAPPAPEQTADEEEYSELNQGLFA